MPYAQHSSTSRTSISLSNSSNDLLKLDAALKYDERYRKLW